MSRLIDRFWVRYWERRIRRSGDDVVGFIRAIKRVEDDPELARRLRQSNARDQADRVDSGRPAIPAQRSEPIVRPMSEAAKFRYLETHR